MMVQVPNVMEFADWVGRTKQKPIYVTGEPAAARLAALALGRALAACRALLRSNRNASG